MHALLIRLVLHRAAMIALVFFLFSACRPTPDRDYLHLAGEAQGTTFSIKYDDPARRDFTRSVDSLFRILDNHLSLWDTTSVICQINRKEESDSLPDSHFRYVLEAALEMANITHGAFDPTVAPLVRIWGFALDKNLPEPDSASLRNLLSRVGYEKIELIPGRLIRHVPGLEIDLNGLAQGYSVDLISDFLRARDVKNYMVEIGGEVYAAGVNERNEPWQIGIDKPVEEAAPATRELQLAIPLSGRALATSGSYRKFREKGGRKISHIIDPRTGFPVPHQLVSVSVIAPNAMTADAWATAIMVLGLEKGMAMADSIGLEVFGITLEQDGRLTTRFTDAFPR